MTPALPAPRPEEGFTVRTLAPDEVGTWYHVYGTALHPQTTALTFAEGWGETRFAPIAGEDGSPVHTYYLASTRETVYMESLLHDVALSPPGLFEVDSLRHYHLVALRLAHPLHYVSFHTHDLPRLGLARAQLVDSLTDCYPQTRAWSQAAFVQRPEAQAIGYGSRRHDAGRCLMLFGQRLPAPPFTVIEERSLATPGLRHEVLSLVRSLGIQEI